MTFAEQYEWLTGEISGKVLSASKLSLLALGNNDKVCAL